MYKYGIEFNTDGTKMFVVGRTNNNIDEYTVSTGFDVSTASYDSSLDVSSQEQHCIKLLDFSQ